MKLTTFLTISSLVASSLLAAEPPAGFRAIFNGKDLTGWHGLNPHTGAKLEGEKKEANLKQQREEFPKHWHIENGELVNVGTGPYATTDEEFGLGTMQDLASSVKDIGIENVQFITVPIVDYEPDPNRVAWAPEAEDLWRTLRDDVAPGEARKPGGSASAEPLTASPTGITVEVVNATGVQGLASEVAAALTVQGFASVATSSTVARPNGVVVEFGTGQDEAARTVAAAFEGARVRANADLGDTVRVTLGAGAPAVQEVPNRTGSSPLPTPSVSAPSPSPKASLETRTADQDICS